MIRSAEEFLALRESEDLNLQRRASVEEASPGIWRQLLDSAPEMAFWIAQNKTIPVEVVRELAGHTDPRVRDMIARKRRTPEEILMSLASDDDEGVRLAVACNPKAPDRVLHHLLSDRWKTVAEEAHRRLGKRRQS